MEIGQTISVNLLWRGQLYRLQMFFSGSRLPTRQEVTKQVQGIYPGAVVQMVYPSSIDPTKPTIRISREETEIMSEEGLRDWFGKSKSKDGKKGWVNVVTGDSCASDKPGEGIPKCVSSAKRASMSKKERRAAAAAKRREDPGQQKKSGAAAPTMVKTDRKKKTKKEELELLDAYGEPFAVIDDLITPEPMKKEEPKIDLTTYDIEAMTEAKDKKGKGSGTKDACYHKVKSRYSVWPSAYASGALVKCRKVGAANWGNSKKEDYTYELNDDYYNTLFEKCWKGYEKKGMKTMFGKRYPNCVKKEEVEQLQEKPGDGYLGPTPIPNPIRMARDASDVQVRRLRNQTNRINRITGRTTVQQTGQKTYNRSTSPAYNRYFGKPGQGLASDSYQPEGEMTEATYPSDFIDKRTGKPKSVANPKKDRPMSHDQIMSGGRRKTVDEAAWTKKAGKDPEGGLNEKGRKSYERENPGSDLKRPSKKVGNKRRASFCARMKGMKKKLTSAKTANDPDSRINKSLRAWNC